ncbi:T9SS type A sorting domain-containing protein [Aureitalea sp. L0-47]|uniref:T9SS type A sorting domain-containing protein n=1 Tax=Aureitalea sp. L0-47 TaxID=2816962 RepID=UPI002237395A|nr:T9SS type A sorting domain-containing protein [Aureitalea sp. L0-47]MCW5518999.1 T9SS type A sorting domain-containing protein [Aureitalea sp. L0-47]
MKQKLLTLFVLSFFYSLSAQDIYVVNSLNELKIVNSETFTVTDLFAVDAQQAGFITDLAFSPDGRLFAVTNSWTLLEIDLQNETFIPLANLPIADPYTALVCNSSNELFTARILSEELYSYNIDTGDITLVETGISTPGDFTYFKGNLVYPNIMNDFIKAYDGSTISNVGCSVPLLWTFVNVFTDCEDNIIYGFDQFAKMYRYDLETEDFEVVADLVQETGLLYGGATMTEYMASDCPVASLETVTCEPLGTENFNEYGIALKSNPVQTTIDLVVNIPYKLSYSLYNTQGRLVSQGKVYNQAIPVGDLSAGLYFLQLSEENGLNVFSKKIAIK